MLSLYLSRLFLRSHYDKVRFSDRCSIRVALRGRSDILPDLTGNVETAENNRRPERAAIQPCWPQYFMAKEFCILICAYL